jgi:hypothetical protein
MQVILDKIKRKSPQFNHGGSEALRIGPNLIGLLG